MSLDKRIRVLVAEDDTLLGEMLRSMLKESGYMVVGVASNGWEAIEMTKKLKPDVLLTDIRMPDMDGLEAARLIQACQPTPIVALTAYETPELVEQASHAGVGAYLLKPPDIRELERAIKIAIARFADILDLRALNTELDAYAHTVAHDLKNRLSGILSVADYLVEDSARIPQEDLREYLSIIARTAYKMNDTIESLLLMAETREVEVNLEPLDMACIVHDARQSLAWMIEARNAEVDIPPTWPTALGHASWIEGVWVNYLSNAVKYGGQPPHLQLGAAKQDDDMVRFWVQDDGPGVSPEARQHIFTPFSRLSKGVQIGHGLGLSIVQRVVHKLGGQVGVESTGGHGSLFYFTLRAANFEENEAIDYVD